MTLGNRREREHCVASLTQSNCRIICGLATTQEQDEREKRVQNCLAKSAYCKWVASITVDKQYKDLCVWLSDEWKKEAEEIRRQ